MQPRPGTGFASPVSTGFALVLGRAEPRDPHHHHSNCGIFPSPCRPAAQHPSLRPGDNISHVQRTPVSIQDSACIVAERVGSVSLLSGVPPRAPPRLQRTGARESRPQRPLQPRARAEPRHRFARTGADRRVRVAARTARRWEYETRFARIVRRRGSFGRGATKTQMVQPKNGVQIAYPPSGSLMYWAKASDFGKCTRG